MLLSLANMMKYLLKYILQNIILLKCYLFLNSTIVVIEEVYRFHIPIPNEQCLWAEMLLLPKLSKHSNCILHLQHQLKLGNPLLDT